MHKHRTYGTLEAAVANLIDAVGGLDTAQRHTRVKKSQLQVYCDPDGKLHIPADVIADLEGIAGGAYVTEWLAQRLGHQLIKVTPKEEHNLSINVAEIGAGASQLFEEFVKALSNDGVVDSVEAECLMEKGDKMLKAYLSLRTELMAKLRPNTGKI